MDLNTLKQYRALKKEIAGLDATIDRLCSRLESVPVVKGKVQSSMKDYPYVRTSVTVDMSDPVEASKIDQLIRLKRRRREQAFGLVIRIEEYIHSIPDSTDRQIMELVFIDGLTYRSAGDALGYDYTTIAYRIRKQLSTNSTK